MSFGGESGQPDAPRPSVDGVITADIELEGGHTDPDDGSEARGRILPIPDGTGAVVIAAPVGGRYAVRITSDLDPAAGDDGATTGWPSNTISTRARTRPPPATRGAPCLASPSRPCSWARVRPASWSWWS